jgi:RHS repeat-associated protein
MLAGRCCVYTSSLDQPAAPGFTSFFVKDAQGSTIALTDSSGVVQTTYSYGPFGQTASSGQSSDNPYQFVGRENDSFSIAGFYNFRARYLDTTTGRFASSDPDGFSGGSHNLYSYANSNPLNLMDPTGREVPIGVGPGGWVFEGGDTQAAVDFGAGADGNGGASAAAVAALAAAAAASDSGTTGVGGIGDTLAGADSLASAVSASMTDSDGGMEAVVADSSADHPYSDPPFGCGVWGKSLYVWGTSTLGAVGGARSGAWLGGALGLAIPVPGATEAGAAVGGVGGFLFGGYVGFNAGMSSVNARCGGY